MFYKHIPQPSKEVFDLDLFVLDAKKPGIGISKDVKISGGVMASAEELFHPNGGSAGTLIFIPYLNKISIGWPT